MSSLEGDGPEFSLAFSIAVSYISGFFCFLGGAWRSLVAHMLGVHEVAGSNPVAPILQTPCNN